RISGTPPRGVLGQNPYDPIHDAMTDARRILTGLGLSEAQGQTLISEAVLEALGWSGRENLVRLANPLSSDMNVLRPALLPGLLAALEHNVHRKTNDLALFELGRVFTRSQNAFGEERRLALALTGRRQPLFWSGGDREAKLDIYDLKGWLEEFFE